MAGEQVGLTSHWSVVLKCLSWIRSAAEEHGLVGSLAELQINFVSLCLIQDWHCRISRLGRWGFVRVA